MATALAYNNSLLRFNNYVIDPGSTPVPPTPILPANTVRVRTSDGQPPIKADSTSYETATLVPGTTDVYDVYKSGTSFYGLLSYSTNVTEVLGVNTTGITSLREMFSHCTSLTTVPLFDTSSITNTRSMFSNCTSLTTVPLFDTSSVSLMQNMFIYCSSLTTVPLFNTSSATNMGTMFQGCYNVQSGALALYQQASSQDNVPDHYHAFKDCGRDTTTGAAELAQIPSEWK